MAPEPKCPKGWGWVFLLLRLRPATRSTGPAGPSRRWRLSLALICPQTPSKLHPSLSLSFTLCFLPAPFPQIFVSTGFLFHSIPTGTILVWVLSLLVCSVKFVMVSRKAETLPGHGEVRGLPPLGRSCLPAHAVCPDLHPRLTQQQTENTDHVSFQTCCKTNPMPLSGSWRKGGFE